MSKNTSSQKGHSTSNISIVDGKLILSLPNAEMPVVWQMDLEQAQSSAFTVQEDKKKKVFTLVSKTQDNAADEIASFEEKQDAVDALMETSSVLQNAHGQIKPGMRGDKVSAPANSNHDNEKSDKVGAFLALALIIVLGLIWMMSASQSVQLSGNDMGSLTSSSQTPASARESSGVPVSADDFLNNR